MDRYKILPGSLSSHCCFEATVVDTTRPVMAGGEHYQDSDGQLHYETVCECFEKADAELICSTLNGIAVAARILLADLLPPERECCGTFIGTAHRVTCPKYRG